jgi:hypothetical protein
MKVKLEITAKCPYCGANMHSSTYRGKDVLECYSMQCPEPDKKYKLPEIEIEEYKDAKTDTKKSD